MSGRRGGGGRRRGRAVLGMGLAALCLASAPAPAAERDGAGIGTHVLTIGRVTTHPERHADGLGRMVDYAAARMRDLGIVAGRVVTVANPAAMAEYLRSGKVDWVTETPFLALSLEENGHAEIVARRWKNGVPDYFTVFFVRADSDIRSLDDLDGRTIAFEDPGSTSGYFLPAATLINRHQRLVRLSNSRLSPPPGAVGFVFSGGERTTAAWVGSGVVDAGALSDRDWNDPQRVPPKVRKTLRVIHETQRVPRAVELVRKDLDPRVKARLIQLLVHAHEDPEAADALYAHKKTRRFDPIDARLRADLDALRPVGEIVRQQLDR